MKNLSEYIHESYVSGIGRKLKVRKGGKNIRERKKDISIRLNESRNSESRWELQVLNKNDKTGFCCTQETYTEAIEKFGEGAEVINAAYTDYGGSIEDHALIKYYQDNHPELAVWENTGWNGENMIAIPVEGVLKSDYFYQVEGFEDTYYELEREIAEEDARYFCQENPDYEDMFDEIVDWLPQYARLEATGFDFDWDTLKEHLDELKAATGVQESVKTRKYNVKRINESADEAAKALINNYKFPNKAFESYGNGNPDIDFDITEGEEPIKSVVTIPRSSYDGYTFGTSISLAGDLMSALEGVVAYIQNNEVAKGCLIELEEVEEDYNRLDDEEKAEYEDSYQYATEYLNYIYVDPSMAGGSTPCYIDGNVRIESIEEFGERAY